MTTRKDLFLPTIEALKSRGVKLEELAKIVYNAQKKYSPEITIDIALEHVEAVLKKREIQHAVLTGIAIDVAAENNLLEGPILDVIKADDGLYGPDETLAFSITNCYGSIASSNFGNFDINKPGIIGEFNDRQANSDEVHTFLDDILGAIAASASSRFAHQNG